MVWAACKASFLNDLQDVYPDYLSWSKEIEGACDLAIEAHEGQFRKYDGTPYVTHPMAVALDVAEKYQDHELVCAALLHDTVEDCDDVCIEDIYTQRGESVGLLVEAVTDSPFYFIQDPDTVYRDKIEKLLAGGMQDVRVLLLKIADRDHNLKTLDGLMPHKQIRMTFETQAIYEPLREILLWESKKHNIKEIMAKLDLYLTKKYISDVWWFKHNLFNQTYKNFNHETFHLAYQNTDRIIWEIWDIEWLKELVKSSNFKDNIDIISLESDWKEYLVRFWFKWWFVSKWKNNPKMKVYNLTTS